MTISGYGRKTNHLEQECMSLGREGKRSFMDEGGKT